MYGSRVANRYAKALLEYALQQNALEAVFADMTLIDKTIKSHKDLGFDAEVMKAIKKWRFKPIFHKGKNIKVYFTKTFVFEPQQ